MQYLGASLHENCVKYSWKLTWHPSALSCLPCEQANRLWVTNRPWIFKANIFLSLTGQLCLRTVKRLSALGERHRFQPGEWLGCSRDSLLWVGTVWQLSCWSLLRWLWHLENLVLMLLWIRAKSNLEESWVLNCDWSLGKESGFGPCY